MRKVLAFATLLAAGLGLAAVAHATTLGTATIEFTDPGPGRAAFVSRPGAGLTTTEAGCYLFSADPSQEATGEGSLLVAEGQFSGFCMQLEQPAVPRAEPYAVVSLTEALESHGAGTASLRAHLLQNLWWQHFDPAWEAESVWTVAQRDAAAAFAACVWEIVYESPGNVLDVTTGTLRVGGGYRVTANAWLRGLNADGPQTLLRALTSDLYQDYLVEIGGVVDGVVPEPRGNENPEPVTLVGVGLGILGLARYVRGRRAVRA